MVPKGRIQTKAAEEILGKMLFQVMVTPEKKSGEFSTSIQEELHVLPPKW